MPRNSSGTYTLPAGNPVVTGTTISSTWANTTLTDLANAMTDSLSRSGDGGMQAPLFLDDGAVGAPGLSWGNEPTSGLYRAGAGDFRYSVSATEVFRIVAGSIRAVAGSAGTPPFSFSSDTNTGIYSVGADDIGFTVGGTLRLDISTTGITSTLPFLGAAASAGNPQYSFSGDPNTGSYSVGADDWGISTGGTLRFDISTTAMTATLPFRGQDGSISAPAWSFSADTNTGAYRAGADDMRLTVGGTDYLQLTTASSVGARFGTRVSTVDGTVGVPAYTFTNDLDIGMYRAGANDLRFAAEGFDGLRVTTSGTFGIAQINLGSTAFCGLSFIGDANTGLVSPSADVVALVAGGHGGLQCAVNGGGVSDTTIGNSNGSSLTINNATSASASAGGTAIPTAAGFLTVTVNGTVRKIPFCAN